MQNISFVIGPDIASVLMGASAAFFGWKYLHRLGFREAIWAGLALWMVLLAKLLKIRSSHLAI